MFAFVTPLKNAMFVVPPRKVVQRALRTYSVFMAVPRNAGNAPATCVRNCFRRKHAAIAIAMIRRRLRQTPCLLRPNKPQYRSGSFDEASASGGFVVFRPGKSACVPGMQAGLKISASRNFPRLGGLQQNRSKGSAGLHVQRFRRTVAAIPSICLLVSLTGLPSRQ